MVGKRADAKVPAVIFVASVVLIVAELARPDTELAGIEVENVAGLAPFAYM